jgi:HEAT repeat protein
MTSEKRPRKSSSLGVVGVLFSYGIARVAPRTAVRHLLAALGSRDEDTSMAAYMALTKMGPKIAPWIIEHIRQGKPEASLMQLLGDLGNPAVIEDLKEFGESDDEKVSAAAKESLEILGGKKQESD